MLFVNYNYAPLIPVSYTHLDVYKRQHWKCSVGTDIGKVPKNVDSKIISGPRDASSNTDKIVEKPKK